MSGRFSSWCADICDPKNMQIKNPATCARIVVSSGSLAFVMCETLVLIRLKRGSWHGLDIGSLLHLRSGLWRPDLSGAAADLRHPAGMQGGWQCLAEPRCQPDADGCEHHLQLGQLPVKKKPGTFARA